MRLTYIAFCIVSLSCSRSSAQPSATELNQRIAALSAGESFTIDKFKFTLHRKAAGSPRTDGWYEAKSTGLGFTVLLPGPFNDFSQSVPATNGATIHNHAVGTRTLEGDKFVATCFTRDDNQLPSDWAASSVESLSHDVTVVNKQGVEVRGFRGFELTIAGKSGSRLFARFLQRASIGCQLSVESPPSSDDYAPQLARVFMDSFDLPESDHSGAARQ